MATFYRCDRCKKELSSFQKNEVCIKIKEANDFDDDRRDAIPAQDYCSECLQELKNFTKPITRQS